MAGTDAGAAEDGTCVFFNAEGADLRDGMDCAGGPDGAVLGGDEMRLAIVSARVAGPVDFTGGEMRLAIVFARVEAVSTLARGRAWAAEADPVPLAAGVCASVPASGRSFTGGRPPVTGFLPSAAPGAAPVPPSGAVDAGLPRMPNPVGNG